jgi:pilus assembly protein FimV
VKHTIWAGTITTAIAFVAATAAIAQTPAAQQAPGQADKTIVLTGCLRAAPSSADTAGTAGAAGTPGAAGTTGAGATATASATGAAADQKFVLMEATAAADPSAPAAAADAAASSAKQTYRLVANPSALSPHVGKKLELTGTIEPSSGADAGPGPALRVASGKIIAASCDEQ